MTKGNPKFSPGSLQYPPADRIMPDAKKLGKKSWTSLPPPPHSLSLSLSLSFCLCSAVLSALVVFLSSGDYSSGDLITELFNSDDSCVPTYIPCEPELNPRQFPFILTSILIRPTFSERGPSRGNSFLLFSFSHDNENYISMCKSSVHPSPLHYSSPVVTYRMQ